MMPSRKMTSKQSRKEIQILHSHQFNLQPVLPGKTVQSAKGIIVLDRGLETEHQGRPLLIHPEHIVAVVAADVRDHFISERGHFRQQPVPFTFAAPLGIDVDAENAEWTFAPGHEGPQAPADQFQVVRPQIIGGADPHHIAGKVAVGGPDMSHRFQRLPIAEKALFLLADPLFFLPADQVYPVMVCRGEKIEIVHLWLRGWVERQISR